MPQAAVTIYPLTDVVLLKVFVEHDDHTHHQVFATPEDAGKIAVLEAMKPTTVYVQIRRENG